MEQLKVSTNDLPSVAKKKVIAVVVLVSSTKAFPTTEVASIPSRKVKEEYWNSGLDDRLEAVAVSIQLETMVVATSEAARLRETLPMVSRVLDPYKNTVT
jgi:hypothetical protein